MTVKFIYAGPSWAHKSYDHPSVENNNGVTNLAKEWGFKYIDNSLPGCTILNRVKLVKHTLEMYPKLPIIWIYGEPLCDMTTITNLSTEEFIQKDDWVDIWHMCNQYCLSQIAALGNPVLLIGAHSDIVNCNYANISIGHASWQKYIANLANIPFNNDKIHVKMHDGNNFFINRCWGAEIAHIWMHRNQKISPQSSLVDAVLDIFFFWKELEKANLFYEVHPNRQATTQFAKLLLPTVEKFLQDNK